MVMTTTARPDRPTVLRDAYYYLKLDAGDASGAPSLRELVFVNPSWQPDYLLVSDMTVRVYESPANNTSPEEAALLTVDCFEVRAWATTYFCCRPVPAVAGACEAGCILKDARKIVPS